jgi:ribonuclease D
VHPADSRPTVATDDLPADLYLAYKHSARVAWDVETTGLDYQSARLATCQLWSPSVGVTIIQLHSKHAPRLESILADPEIEKVFHHAPFDLRFMRSSWGTPIRSVKCTKVASKLLSPSLNNEEHSLARLLSRYLGVSIDKGAVRVSDWSIKTLSQEQLTYASRDVLYLLDLIDRQEELLAANSLYELYEACCQFIPWRVELDMLDAPDVFAY